MKVRIQPGKLKGGLAVPASKSEAHRAAIFIALSLYDEREKGAVTAEKTEALFRERMNEIAEKSLLSQDVLATVDCLTNLLFTDSGVYDCRESGSTLRFLLPVVLALKGEGEFRGSPKLMERGVSVYEEVLKPLGVTFEKTENALIVKGKLPVGTYAIPGNISSQYISGFLMAFPLLSGERTLIVREPVESVDYMQMTLEIAARFGVDLRAMRRPGEGVIFDISGPKPYKNINYSLDGDRSLSANFRAFIETGSSLEFTGLLEKSLQGDAASTGFFKTIREAENPEIHLENNPDLGPVLFAFSAALGKNVVFTGIRRLRYKESDRIAAMCEELRKFGISTEIRYGESEKTSKIQGEKDYHSLRILPGTLKKPAVPLNGHHDHRIVMALSFLLSLTGGEIEGAEAVEKSAPRWFETLKRLGLPVEIYE